MPEKYTTIQANQDAITLRNENKTAPEIIKALAAKGATAFYEQSTQTIWLAVNPREEHVAAMRASLTEQSSDNQEDRQRKETLKDIGDFVFVTGVRG